MISLVSLYRLLDTRRRIRDRMWAARSVVVARQLAAMRQTYPDLAR